MCRHPGSRGRREDGRGQKVKGDWERRDAANGRDRSRFEDRRRREHQRRQAIAHRAATQAKERLNREAGADFRKPMVFPNRERKVLNH